MIEAAFAAQTDKGLNCGDYGTLIELRKKWNFIPAEPPTTASLQ